MAGIRSFIALEFSDEARAEFARVEELLKKADANVKWVDPGSMHLTLKFLGNVPEEQIPSISGRLEKIASETAPFDVLLEDMGVFPKWDYVRVLWIGIGEGGGCVKDLAERVEEAMLQEGFSKEKRSFSPHVTIGRARSSKNKDKLKEIAGSIEIKPVPIHISRVVLFKSELSSTGAVHTPLSVLVFGG